MVEAGLKEQPRATPHSRPKSARCCAACCGSAACASMTSWCRAPTSSRWRRTTRLSELLRVFSEAGVSRIPLFSETLDDPRGMIHIKDLFRWLTKEAAGEIFNPPIAVVANVPVEAAHEHPPPCSTSAASTCRARSRPPRSAARSSTCPVHADDQPAHSHAVDAHPHGARCRRVRRHRRARHHRGPRRADRRRYRGRARRGGGGLHLGRAQARARRLGAHAHQASSRSTSG